MHGSLARARWGLACIAALAIAAGALLLASALRTQHRTNEEIRQHFETVLDLRGAQASLVDAETGQRGFLLTSDPGYLMPYERARAELPARLNRLVQMQASTPGDRLQSLAAAKMAELAGTVRLVRSGERDAALARVATGKGKGYMDAIRTEVSWRIDRQQRQLETEIRRAESFTTRIYLALGLVLVACLVLVWFVVTMVWRTGRLEAETQRLREVEAAERRTALVARELNHRVKNLFSIVLAIVQLAGRGTATPKEAITRIRERVQALARAHEVSLGDDPMAGFDLEAMLSAILTPYALDGAALELSGPPVKLPPMRVTPLGLIVYELATNAVKYGAWTGDGGTVAVRWSVANGMVEHENGGLRRLRLSWIESRRTPLAADAGSGFGSRMIDAAVAQLNGSLVKQREDHGLTITIEAPIIPAEQGEERNAA